MLRNVFCILLLFAGMLFFDTLREPAITESTPNVAKLTEARENIDVLLAVLTANENAELSLRQNNTPTGYQLARRLFPGKRPEGKFSCFSSGGPVLFLPELYRTYLFHFRESYARKKMTGYYMYTLCKILI